MDPNAPPPLPSELKDRVIGVAGEQRSPTRAAVRNAHALLAVLAATGLLTTFFVWGGFREWGAPRIPLLIVITAVGAAAITSTCLYMATLYGRSMVGPSARVLILTALGTTLALLAWKYGVTAAFPGQLDLVRDRLGFKCLILGSTMGAFPLIALLWARRGSSPNHPLLTGIVFGVTSGALAWVFVDLWCPASYFRHLLIGHVWPIANLSLIGAVVGAWWLSLPRYRGR